MTRDVTRDRTRMERLPLTTVPSAPASIPTQDRQQRDQPASPPSTSASIVICTRDRPDSIARAVESVACQPYASFEVVVVDQSRSDATGRIVTELIARYPHVHYVHLDQVGLS